NLLDERLLKDTSLLTDDPCAAPCWNNIIPGETSWRDAKIAIEDNTQFINVEEIKDENSEAKLLNFHNSEDVPCCRIYSTLDGDLVGQVLTLLAPGQITLDEILEKYGDPSYVAGSDVTPEQTLLSLIFPDVPVIVYVFSPGTAE